MECQKVREPISWDRFENSLILNPIAFEDLVTDLSKKENIFMWDTHGDSYLLTQLSKLMSILPTFDLYLEFSQKYMDQPDFFENKNPLYSFKERIKPLIEDQIDLPHIQKLKYIEDQIKKVSSNNSKKIIFTGKDHLRPGNGVQTHAPDLAQIAVIYYNLDKNKESKWQHSLNSECIYGFTIYNLNKV